MKDDLSSYYAELLDGTYDCVDRIVLNAYNGLCYSPGGFRNWWRAFAGSDKDLDNAHLMRFAGRFSRRVRSFAKAKGIPLMDCASAEKKHLIAEEYLKDHPDVRDLFLILVSRAIAPVWDVQKSANGTIRNLSRKQPFINHYSFHIMDREWGHITIKMSGHPPFGAQVILNGHEYVACRARKTRMRFTKDGNCFTIVSNMADLVRVADTLSDSRTVGRLTQVCERWIYFCLWFALSPEDQKRSGWRYDYSVYQVEYSQNLLFQRGAQMDQVFQGMIDRTRARIDVPRLRTIFGAKHRPQKNRKKKARLEVVVERPTYDLTVLKLHFGKLTLKAYTKGEHVLRFEAIVHNTTELGCGRSLIKFPYIIARLSGMLQRFLNNLHCLGRCFVSDETLNQLPLPSQVGSTRVGGIDLNKPRTRAALAAALSLSLSPKGFIVSEFASRVQSITGQSDSQYGKRRAAYDLKKLRGKKLLEISGRRYKSTTDGLRTIAAVSVLRDKVIQPLLAGAGKLRMGRKPRNWSSIDEHYRTLCIDMQRLFTDLGIAA
jgi:hypothetical protein